MLHTSTVISYLQSFVFVYKFCLNELRLATDLLGGQGIQTSPYLALNSRLPRLFPWLPSLSLDLALVVCEILSIVA